tara:strand:- start:5441 stop:5947 length:507 start_codon:yes stop_codon:yes gene_type:complete
VTPQPKVEDLYQEWLEHWGLYQAQIAIKTTENSAAWRYSMANEGSGFTTGLLVGGIIGTVIGILIAPKPGEETRADLLEKSDLIRHKADEFSETIRDRVGPTVDSISERLGPTVEATREKLIPAVENAREKIIPLVDQVNERFSDFSSTHTDSTVSKTPEGEDAGNRS